VGLIAYLGNILFYSFSLRGLFCTSDFSTRKHELNSEFSVRVFTGSVRDALSSQGSEHSRLICTSLSRAPQQGRIRSCYRYYFWLIVSAFVQDTYHSRAARAPTPARHRLPVRLGVSGRRGRFAAPRLHPSLALTSPGTATSPATGHRILPRYQIDGHPILLALPHAPPQIRQLAPTATPPYPGEHGPERSLRHCASRVGRRPAATPITEPPAPSCLTHRSC
jgi:hypothetical protein